MATDKRRRNPTEGTARAGNYAQEVDFAGMDPEMKRDLKGFSQRAGESDKDYLKRQRKRVNKYRASKGKSPL